MLLTISLTVLALFSSISCSPVTPGVQQEKLLQLNNCAQICRYPAMECEYTCQGNGRCEVDCQRELALCVRKCYTDLLTEIEQLSLIDPEWQLKHDAID
ncbi:hypothetical protein D915_007762 [Fasciola hepatica]|uniref:Uncharacterized protein n=1 Tax=Fasciola hepatica TaxID=6192 RepID=A0A4E0R621_FASHE|nr:hypothetical protein D915_007762 [Fasciola hepatica]